MNNEPAEATEELAFNYYLCPEEGCEQLAVSQWKTRMASTDGPMEVTKINCLNGHWFLQPTAGLEPA